MKRILFFMVAIMLSSLTFLTSCTDDSDPVNLPPTIGFVAGPGLISDDATLTVNDNFDVKILAEANTTSNSKLQSLKVTRVFDLQSFDTTFTFNETTLTFPLTFTAQSQAGVERIEFKVTDKDGQSATIDINITTEEFTTSISTFTMKVLGSYDNSTGSSFASIDGSVYTLAEAFLNQAKVDFLYWWGASTSATIGAPDDDKANLVFTGVYGLPSWNPATKNATRFKTTSITAAEFDAINDGNELETNASGSDQTRIGSLVVDHVIAFMTVSGKYGLIKVTNIDTGTAGAITIDVKVQQ